MNINKYLRISIIFPIVLGVFGAVIFAGGFTLSSVEGFLFGVPEAQAAEAGDAIIFYGSSTSVTYRQWSSSTQSWGSPLQATTAATSTATSTTP